MRQKVYYPADEEKIPLLIGLLSRSEGARTMVFVNTKAFVERVARRWKSAGYRVGVLSGDVPQKKRESLLKKFQAGQLEILVATDVAARGLHIDGVSHVYNYDLPFDAEDYVHRIGRTARLGAEGDAISFACERYAMSLPDIEAYIDQKIPGEPCRRRCWSRCRARRASVVEGAGEADADESISTIFREAREQRAADEERRGGGGRGRGGKPAGGRRAVRRRRAPGPRRERTPRPPRKHEGEPAAATAQAPRPPAAARSPRRRSRRAPPHLRCASRTPEGERGPRKRRRRRGGRRIEGADALRDAGHARRSSARRRQARHADVADVPLACSRASARA